MADVTDLDAERKRRKRKKKKNSEPIPQAEMFYQIVLKMNRDPLAPRAWPEFPRRFHLACDEQGNRTVFEEVAPKTVVYKVERAVSEAILQYCYSELEDVPGAEISPKAADSCRQLWISLTPPLQHPPVPLVEKSDVRYALKRLDFDAPVARTEDDRIIIPEAPPHFAEFLARCSQPDALAAFIGSLFYPEADRQQYVYLHGDGLDGKGALLRFLYMLLGPAAQALQPKRSEDRFWNMKIWGKRLIIFSDCEDLKFFSSPEFKAITGSDPIFFEPKGSHGFSDFPTCKIIAGSNFKPSVSSQRSDLRRLIYVDVKPVASEDLIPHYEKLLLEEAAGIVAYCKAVYEQLCPGNRPIPCSLADDVAACAEELFLSVFTRYFEVCDPETYTSGHAVLACINQEPQLRQGRALNRMKAAWSRHFGVEIRRAPEGVRYYGMRLLCSVNVG